MGENGILLASEDLKNFLKYLVYDLEEDLKEEQSYGSLIELAHKIEFSFFRKKLNESEANCYSKEIFVLRYANLMNSAEAYRKVDEFDAATESYIQAADCVRVALTEYPYDFSLYEQLCNTYRQLEKYYYDAGLDNSAAEYCAKQMYVVEQGKTSKSLYWGFLACRLSAGLLGKDE